MSREFRHLAREHGGRIYSFALHALRSKEDAEDVTQEVLVRLWRYRDGIDPEKVHAWVMKVARNRVIDVSRRRRIRAGVMPEGMDVELVSESIAAPEAGGDHAERAELRGVLQDAVAALDEPYRSIVIMREMQDRSYSEIAEALEMPLGTVKVYLHRARRRLRERVKKELGHVIR
jgi:RNA polymerase sigma-70 factor (ECF subfamily)